MPDRFFSAQPIAGGTVVLAGAEAHHLIHVLRAKPGLAVTLFDGSGAEYAAQVVQVGRSEVTLAIDQRCDVDRELPIRLCVGVALPKQDRQRWLVEKLVELGVDRLVPLLAARAVAQPSPEALERLGRTVVEASKQCGRNRLMEIASGQKPAEFWQSLASVPVRWLAHPGGAPLPTALAEAGPANAAVLAIGPEGGFTDEEVAAAKSSGWQTIDLGNRILRIETAACALATAAALLPKS
jgi:16S rRNA (uracil1498-N3)-methyltransferase